MILSYKPRKVQDRFFTREVLNITSKLLTQNPEYYTVWNYRRIIALHLIGGSDEDSGLSKSSDIKSQSNEGIAQLISNDLDFLLPLLRKFPKCYWIWNYRLWLLEEASSLLPEENSRNLWLEELSLVGKMLNLDNRNFHGWGYRRVVVAALERNNKTTGDPSQSRVEQEFQYTTRMIESNLSNFSAWHYRSKLIPRLLCEQGADGSVRQKILDSGKLPAIIIYQC